MLGAVLLVSGAAKLADRGWRPNAVALGTPGWAIPSLPWVELGLGGVLVAAVGYLLYRSGLGALRRQEWRPSQTMESLKEDAQWLKAQTK